MSQTITPRLPTYIRARQEERERSMQTAFPAKVTAWDTASNTVTVEPQHIETWVTLDGVRRSEETPEGIAITNVPVCYPRSGQWAVTFPIETGSTGMVICTKYSLEAWRREGNRADPRDVRKFTIAGATFHPVNLVPGADELTPDSTYMVIGNRPNQPLATDFVALAEKVDAALALIKTHVHPAGTPNTGQSAELSAMQTDTGSATVKASK